MSQDQQFVLGALSIVYDDEQEMLNGNGQELVPPQLDMLLLEGVPKEVQAV